jgi:hypothetical protein
LFVLQDIEKKRDASCFHAGAIVRLPYPWAGAENIFQKKRPVIG